METRLRADLARESDERTLARAAVLALPAAQSKGVALLSSSRLGRYRVLGAATLRRSATATRRSSKSFPNDQALIRLAGALLIEQNDDRLVTRCYLSEDR